MSLTYFFIFDARSSHDVVSGTGWSSYSLLRNIDKRVYNVIVVSPRNHFLFTPLLCSTTVGTLEFRSIIEPVRNSGFRQNAHFLLSHAVSIDTTKRVVTCRCVFDESLIHEVPYDRLVIGIGALSNTFNVPGVEKHAFFLKEIADAQRIRNQILKNFELSLQPKVSMEKAQKLLHFVIVGGGPTGVEFAAELYDFVKKVSAKLFYLISNRRFETICNQGLLLVLRHV